MDNNMIKLRNSYITLATFPLAALLTYVLKKRYVEVTASEMRDKTMLYGRELPPGHPPSWPVWPRWLAWLSTDDNPRTTY